MRVIFGCIVMQSGASIFHFELCAIWVDIAASYTLRLVQTDAIVTSLIHVGISPALGLSVALWLHSTTVQPVRAENSCHKSRWTI